MTAITTLAQALSNESWYVGLLPRPAVGTPDGFFFPIEGNRRVFLNTDGRMGDKDFDELMGIVPDTAPLNEQEKELLRGYNAAVSDGGGQDLKEGLTWDEVYDAMDASGFMPIKDFQWVGGRYQDDIYLCRKGAECYDDYLEDAPDLEAILKEALKRQ
jgi:hypothetical protein